MGKHFRRAVGVLALATVAAACGGGGPSATEKADADAVAQAYLAGASGSVSVTESQAHCLAAKFVAIFGAARLQQLGFTPARLADPKALDALPDPDAAQRDRFAAAMQSCHWGSILATELVSDLHAPDPDTTGPCIGKKLDHDRTARAWLAQSFTDHVTLASARALVGSIDSCVSVVLLVVEASHLSFTDEERACVVVRLTDHSDLNDLVAREIAGQTPKTAEFVRAIAPTLFACVTASRLGQLQSRSTTTELDIPPSMTTTTGDPTRKTCNDFMNRLDAEVWYQYAIGVGYDTSRLVLGPRGIVCPMLPGPDFGR